MKYLACLLAGLGAQLAVAQSIPVTPDGTALALGDVCYTISATKNGKEYAIGTTFQSVRREQVDGVDALAIVVHQRMFDGTFEMRDSLVVRRADLRPIRLDTDRNGAPHVHLDYTANRVNGWKMVGHDKQVIDVALNGPVWDGNLWGETFAALPLKDGGSYRLPVYQYDTGKGSFIVEVTGKRAFGASDAWVLKAGLKEDQLVDYYVGVSPRIELGYAAGPSSQHLGGDCKGLH